MLNIKHVSFLGLGEIRDLSGQMKMVALALAWLLMMMSSPAAMAQGSVPVAVAQDRRPEAPTVTRLVESTDWKTRRHYPEGVLVPGNGRFQPSSVIGARIRITTTSTVELAGLVRLEGRTITGRVLTSDDDSVTTTGGVDQPNVTVPRPHRKIIGVIADLQQQTLTMTRKDRLALTIPRAAIATLERQAGTRSRKRGAALGFLIGGGAGAGIGFLIGSSCHSTAFLGCFMEPAASSFGGMILGGAAGTVTGALAAPLERWEEVQMHWLDAPL